MKMPALFMMSIAELSISAPRVDLSLSSIPSGGGVLPFRKRHLPQLGEYDLLQKENKVGNKLSNHIWCSTAGSGLCPEKIVERRWWEFFSDPSQWCDHRSQKENASYPDFKHKRTHKGLWLDGKFNPQWVETKLAAMSPGIVQSNIFSWNKRLSRHVKAGQYEKTMELFHQMQQEGITPDKFTFVPVVNACTRLRAFEEGRQIHRHITQSGFETDVFVGGCLVDMYAKSGSIEDARKVFNKMPTRDVVTWSALIVGLVKTGQGRRALELSRLMQGQGVDPDSVMFAWLLKACSNLGALHDGKIVHEQIIEKGFQSDALVGSCLIDMYATCGSIEDAQTVFSKMPLSNVVVCNAMLRGYVMLGLSKEALGLFEQMCQNGITADGATLHTLLSAFGQEGLVDEGLNVFDSVSVFDKSLVTMQHYACMVDLLGCAGRLHEAEDLMQSVPCEPNSTVWMSLLNACRFHGNVEMGGPISKQVMELAPENSRSCLYASMECCKLV